MPIAKAFENILKAPFIWKKRLKEPQKPEEEFIYEGRVPGVDIPKQWSCDVLDTADRATALLGEPAKSVYIRIANWMEYLTRSYADESKVIYQERYVGKAIDGWKKEDIHIDSELGSHNPPVVPINPGPVLLQTETIEV